MRPGHVLKWQCQWRQCRNSPGFDPSILRHSGIWGAADEAVLNCVHEKKKKNPLCLKKWKEPIKIMGSFVTKTGTIRGQIPRTSTCILKGPTVWLPLCSTQSSERKAKYQRTKYILYNREDWIVRGSCPSARLLFGSHETSLIIWIGKPATAIPC